MSLQNTEAPKEAYWPKARQKQVCALLARSRENHTMILNRAVSFHFELYTKLHMVGIRESSYVIKST